MKDNLKNFINSKWMILIIYSLAFINFLCDGYIVFSIFIVLSALTIVLLDFNRNILISFFLIYIVGFKMPEEGINFYFYYGSMVFLVLILLYDVLKTKRFNLKNPIVISMFVYLFAISISLIASLIINKNSSRYAFEDIFRFGVWILPVIYLWNNQKNIEEDRNYLCHVILGFSIFMFMQIILFLYNHDFNMYYITHGKEIGLAWSSYSTHVALMFVICFPFIAYLYFQTKKPIYLTIAIIPGIMPMFLQCRGAIYAALFIDFLALIYYFIHFRKDKKAIIDFLLYFVLPVVIIFGVLLFTGVLKAIIDFLLERGLDDTGRLELFDLGLDLFKKHPIFGTGSHTSVFYIKETFNSNIRHYHSIYIQLLSCSGIFGFVCFSSYIIIVVVEAWKNKPFNILFILFIIYLLLHGIVDTTFLNYRVMVFMSVLLPYIKEKNINSEINSEIEMKKALD